MFEPREKGGEVRGRSLLSLGRALQEERARLDAHTAPDIPDHDAAARHRIARAKREAQAEAEMAELGVSEPLPPEPSEEVTTQQREARQARADASGSWLDGLASRFRGEPLLDGPAAVPHADAPRPADVTEAPPELPPVKPAQSAQPEIAPEPPRQEEYRETITRRSSADDHWQPLVDPQTVAGRIARSKGLIATTTLVGALLGIAIALGTPKKYEALAEVLIDPRDLQIVEREITAPGLPSDATLGIIENNARILTSGPVLVKVVDKLNLTSDPEFNGKGGSRLTSLMNPISLVRSLLLRSDEPDESHIASRAAASLADKITVDRTGKTFILNVNVATENAEKSATIANTLVDEYILYAQQLQSATAGKATDELTARLQELRKGVEAAEDKVEAFKSENDIFDPQGRSIADDELIKLNDQLSIARARTLEIDAKADSARQLDVNSVVTGALPEGINSSVLTELRAQYASVKQSVDSARVRLGPRHPQLQALEAQLVGARDQISGELRRLVSSLQVELKRAVELEQDLAARLAQLKVRRGNTSQDLVALRELERDVNSKRAVYESFLLRARETGEQKDLNMANISVISRANPPLESSGPSRAIIAGTGTMIGLLAGLVLAGILGALDSLRETTATGRHSRVTTTRARRASLVPLAKPTRADESVQASPSRLEDQPLSETPITEEVDMHASYPPPTGPYATQQPTPPDYAYGSAQHAGVQPPFAAQPHMTPQQSYPAHPQVHSGYASPPAAPQSPAYGQSSAPEQAWTGYAPPQQAWAPPYQSPQSAYPQAGYANPAYRPYAPASAYPSPPPAPGYAAYAQPPQFAPAPQAMAQAPADMSDSVRSSIEDIRAAVGECRDAIRQLADKHTRRYF